MVTLKVILIAIALVSTAILALSIRIVLVKDGKFPETHISRNPEMKKKGILCVKAMDRMEQAKAEIQNRYKNVTVLK
ncbi:MAG: hypothetical protein GZ094_15850 [Mariniphaga sp.]|nr:hypothetical protein [Mariniphaga sp.]